MMISWLSNIFWVAVNAAAAAAAVAAVAYMVL